MEWKAICLSPFEFNRRTNRFWNKSSQQLKPSSTGADFLYLLRQQTLYRFLKLSRKPLLRTIEDAMVVFFIVVIKI